ncbi:MAG: acyltransferase [Alphaproteobacteria bacterium]
MTVKIHPSADVSPDAKVGDGTVIWQHCVLTAGAVVGARCKLAHNVFVEGGASVGDGVTVKDNVVLYDGVQVSDDVFIGPNAVFTNHKTPRAFISGKDRFKATRIARGATIGANATIVCGTDIGEFAMIAAGAVVTRTVPAYALMAGNPARRMGWVSRAGARLGDDLVCPEQGEKYDLMEGPDGEEVLRPASPE